MCFSSLLRTFGKRNLPDYQAPAVNLMRKRFTGIINNHKKHPRVMEALLTVDKHGSGTVKKNYDALTFSDEAEMSKVIYEAAMGKPVEWPTAHLSLVPESGEANQDEEDSDEDTDDDDRGEDDEDESSSESDESDEEEGGDVNDNEKVGGDKEADGGALETCRENTEEGGIVGPEAVAKRGPLESDGQGAAKKTKLSQAYGFFEKEYNKAVKECTEETPGGYAHSRRLLSEALRLGELKLEAGETVTPWGVKTFLAKHKKAVEARVVSVVTDFVSSAMCFLGLVSPSLRGGLPNPPCIPPPPRLEARNDRVRFICKAMSCVENARGIAPN